jgi:Bacterial Ig-like domain (group 3)
MRNYRKLSYSLLVCIALAWQTAAFASPGELDPAFGNGGIVADDIGCSLPANQAVSIPLVRDAQGSLYLVGTCTAPTPPEFGNQSPSQVQVLKLDANGNRVTDFGSNGIATINTSDIDSATAATIDAAGDIYIVGQSAGFAGSVWEIDGVSGSLVTSFGAAGVVTMSSHDSVNYPNAVLLDGSGNLYVAGENVYLNDTFAVAKLDATNGTLVSSFGTGGVASFSPGGDTISAANALAMDSAGDLYLAGDSEPSNGDGNYEFALVKIASGSGALINSFGSGGMQILDLGANSLSLVSALTLDGAGNMYVAGVTYPSSDQGGIGVVVKATTANGNLITGFGSNGIKTIDTTGDGSTINALAFDGAGHLYVAGLQFDVAAGTADMLVSELDANGNLFAGFGDNGSKIFSISGSDVADSAVLDGNGHLYLSGVSLDFSSDADATERVYEAARLFTADNGSTTTLTSSLNPAAAGNAVTFSAIVTGSGATPTGKVTFSDGGTVICAQVTLASGHATCETSTLSASTSAHAISASYTGDSNNLGSISSVVEELILGDKIFKDGFE